MMGKWCIVMGEQCDNPHCSKHLVLVRSDHNSLGLSSIHVNSSIVVLE